MLQYLKKNFPDSGKRIYEASVLAHLIGRQAILKETKPGNFADADFLPDVLRLALDFWVKKKVISRSEFLALALELRWDAFNVARVEKTTILGLLKEKIEKYVTDGGVIEDFVKDADMAFDALGVTKLNPFHLETVFLTNTMTAYSAGRKKLMDTLPDDEFPLRQVMAVGDDRTRDGHLAIDGYTAASSDPVWDWLKTPFSYCCRCRIRPVHVSEGLAPSGYTPDVRGKKGFEFI